MTQHILVERAGGVLTLTFNRPEKKNALTQDMYAVLADEINAAQKDPAIRVVYLTGAGDAFTAGNDLGDFAGGPSNVSPGGEAPVARYLQSILLAEKPLVAAVNGLAIGVGVTMLLHCDLVYAGRRATFQTPFVNLGLVPEAGSSLLLARQIGHQKASEMFLLGTRIGAEEAERLGLVAGLFDDAALQAEARARALTLAAKAPSAVRLTKGLMRQNRSETAQRMKDEAVHFAAQLKTPEFAEAALAFAERRPADFSKLATV